ncbi:MAG: phosphatase PAP2 family protein [Pseudomonadota bacterium]
MNQVEETLFREVNSLAGQSAAVDLVMLALSDHRLWILVGVIFLLFALRTKNIAYLSLFFAAIIALGIADVISFEVVKPVVARERPCWILANVKLVKGYCGGSYGFTSNHAANAFAVWMITSKAFGKKSRLSLLVLTLATAISISRVYLGVHFWGDILGGAILGMMVGWSAWAIGLKRLADNITRLILGRFHSPG